MNRNVFLLMALIFVFSSCQKDNPSMLLEKATDMIRGTYNCVSMTYLGDAIDIDNDGICSKDLITEFEHFSYGKTIIKRPSFIYPAFDFCQEEFFNLAIPVQDIKYSKTFKEYTMINDLNGSCDYLVFSYSVSEDGCLEFQVRNDHLDRGMNWELDDEFNHIDIYNTHAESIVSFQNGSLVVRMMAAYYDYHTKQFVTGPVELVYERVSYALS